MTIEFNGKEITSPTVITSKKLHPELGELTARIMYPQVISMRPGNEFTPDEIRIITATSNHTFRAHKINTPELNNLGITWKPNPTHK